MRKKYSVTVLFSRLPLIILSLVLLIACCIVYYYSGTNKSKYIPPAFATSVISGQPDIGKEEGYSTLSISDGYIIKLCGNPKIDNEGIDLYLTNLKKNNVWIKSQILDSNGEIISESGLVKQGYFLQKVPLNKRLKDGKNKVTIKIIGYEPDTYSSMGNATLETVFHF